MAADRDLVRRDCRGVRAVCRSAAPHVSGATQIKRKDYDEGASIEAGNEYAAWQALRDAGTPLRVGDLLEGPGGELRICKYVGFDAAQWIVPEVKTGLESAPVAAGPPQGACEAV